MAIAKKRKKFFDVDMPIIKKTTQLQAYNVEDLEGSFLKYDLTRILKGKSIMLQLKVKIKDDQATSTPTELKLMSYYLRRMMRKKTNYVEDSFTAPCSNAKLRIKPFLITRRKVSKAVRRELRSKAKEELVKYLKSKNSEEIFKEILANKLQKTLSLKLKKVYPLSLCEIKAIKVEKNLEPSKEKKEKTKDSKEKPSSKKETDEKEE